MENAKSKINTLLYFLVFITIITIVPLLKVQFVVGTIVNATLFCAVLFLGVPQAIFLGMIPSIIALLTNLLPFSLVSLVPFIMLSNSILVVTFGVLKKRSFLFGALIASLLKFLFLFSVSFLVIKLMIKKDWANTVIALMSYMQLITAMSGAFIAYLINLLKRGK